jgi:hypothetical protein
MISRNFVQQSLKTLAPGFFLLFCFSIGEFAQSPSKAREPRRESSDFEFKYSGIPVKFAIAAMGEAIGLKVEFDESVIESEVFYIEGKNATGEQALNVLLAAKSLQARIIEENKIIVFRYTEANCQKYGRYEPWPLKSCGYRRSN